MTRSKRAQVLKWVGNLLVLSGAAALTWCAISIVRTHLYQAQTSASLDREVLLRPAKVMVSSAPREGALLGRIEIPRVGVSSIILEGTDDHTLALSVGHIPGTALPGREGNMALAGHRDTFFRGLQDIRKRDDILLTTSGGTQHVYEVESMRVVAPEDVYVLDDIGRPILTLVTCYPFHYIGAAPKRFIVQAHRVGS